MEGKVDRRVIKTKERLHDVFIELLSQKPLKNITVKELSEKADINRATFYLHYKDVFDLLEQLEAEVIEKFSDICDSLNADFSEAEFISVFIKLLEFIRENQQLCNVLFGSNGDRSFFEKLVKIVTDKCFDKEQYTSYSFSFVLAGTVGIILNWISEGMAESSEGVATHTLEMIKKIRQM
ncbi:MAG: TetR/AcrR family transcriptional regulator [Clostridia bacterium]|nr:TetR/AcrR family transcriptional regulator [Clostridia bacterium]